MLHLFTSIATARVRFSCSACGDDLMKPKAYGIFGKPLAITIFQAFSFIYIFSSSFFHWLYMDMFYSKFFIFLLPLEKKSLMSMNGLMITIITITIIIIIIPESWLDPELLLSTSSPSSRLYRPFNPLLLSLILHF